MIRPRVDAASLRSFRERFARLDDRTAALVARAFSAIPPPAPAVPEGAEPGPQGTTTVPVAAAVAWLRAHQVAETYRDLGDLAAPLIREDDARRYVMASGLRVVESPERRVVHERSRLPRPRQDRRHAQPGVGRVARAPHV
jgi:hypothetical protein